MASRCPTCKKTIYYGIYCSNQCAETLECLDARAGDPCAGEVTYHAIDPGRTRPFPRCDKHWAQRLDRRQNSMERYENSDTPPAWFDQAAAGEQW